MKNTINKLLVILSFTAYAHLAATQPVVYNGDIYLTSQAAVDSFPLNYPGVTHVLGSMLIGKFDTIHSDIARLDSLASLRVVGGSLFLLRNGGLKNLQGLGHLDTVYGDLRVQLNDSLENLTGLGMFKACTDLYILDNPLMANTKGLNSFAFAGFSMEIARNEKLLSIEGFDNLDTSRYTSIHNNPSLETVAGFPKLRGMGGISMVLNASLKTIGDFPMLLSPVIGYPFFPPNFDIVDNPELTSIGQLPFVQNVETLTLKNCPKLHDISGLQNLKRLWWFEMTNTGVDSLLFGQLERIRFGMQLINNDSLTSLAALHNVNGPIAASIIIDDNDRLPNLDGLNGVTESYELYITKNDSLHHIDGMESFIKVVGGFAIIEYNRSLTNVNGLRNLVYVDTVDDGSTRYFSVYNNALSNLDSVFHLKRVTGAVYIGADSLLQLIDNFNELERCSNLSIYGSQGSLLHTVRGFNLLDSLELSYPPYYSCFEITGGSLKQIEGFESLVYASNYVGINNSPLLDTIAGLQNLHYLKQSIRLKNLPSLRSVDFMSNIDYVKDSISIRNCQSLKDCSALCDIMANGFVGKGIKLYDNDYPCSTLSDVTIWCDSMVLAVQDGSTALLDAPVLKLAPNPAGQTVVVNIPSEIELPCKIELMDSGGRLLFKDQTYSESYGLTLNGFEAGWYLVRASGPTGRTAVSTLVIQP